jgi:hypothetical protein
MFIKQVDTLTEKLDYQQLKLFLHETARILPEHQRNDFLERIENFTDGNKSVNTTIVDDRDLEREYREIDKIITKIEEGEFVLHEILNEEYDDWYHGDEEEFYYEDPEKILDTIESICGFIHKCVDREKFIEGAKVGERLMTLVVHTIGDYGDNELSFSDLVSEKLIAVNSQKAVLEILYCSYHAHPMKERPEVIFIILSNYGLNDIKLEHIFQYGSEELEGVDEFLDILIRYLGERTGRMAEELIKEAMSLKNDPEVNIDIAKTYAKTHPAMLLQLLTDSQGRSSEQMLDLGMRALDLIDKKYLIRSEVALMTAVYASILGEDIKVETCYIEAFRSRTSPTDYLRALLECEDRVKTRENLQEILKGVLSNQNSYIHDLYVNSELAENKVTPDIISALEFLNGEFERVLNRRMNKKEALGWSGTFMKQGLALFILLLFQGEQLQFGGRSMLESARFHLDFSAQGYESGFLEKTGKSDSDVFLECILRWKEIVSIDELYAEKVILRLEKMLERRVAGIMEANRRNYYGECAAYIAALGEVKESRGEQSEKQRFMHYFRKKYPRRSAFKAALEMYGYTS